MSRALPLADASTEAGRAIAPDSAIVRHLRSATGRPDRVELALIVFGGALVGLLIALAAADVNGQVVLWENAHWTLAGAIATAVAAIAARRSTGLQRRLRALIALSAATWFVGQLMWDVQTAIGLFSVPAPSDIGFLGAVIPAIVALLLAVHGRLPRAEELAVYLDATTIFLAITALILATYGDRLGPRDPVQSAVVAAYPIVHLGTAAAGLVGLLAIGARPRLGGFVMLGSFALLGGAWVAWLGEAVVSMPQAGSFVNAAFSVGILGVGVGGAYWSVSQEAGARVQRATTLVLGGLPILALLGGVAIVLPRRFEGRDVGPIDAIAFAVMLLASVRQTLLVYERGRLLEDSRDARDRLETALVAGAEADSRYRELVEHVPAAVYVDVEDDIVSDGGRLAYISPRIESMLGYSPEAFLADPELWPGLIHPDDRDGAITAYLEHWRTGEPLRAEYRMTARDGSLLWVRDEAFAMPVTDVDAGRVSQGLLIDTTEQKRLEAQLVHDALHDPLTGLANRVLFDDHVERALSRGRRSRSNVAVLFLDLDDFKVVNDSLGHRAGDRLLVEVARRLGNATRAGDIAARQGGDEFTVLLEGVESVADAVTAADRISLDLGRPIELEGRSVVVGVSIGIALTDHDEPAAEDLMAHADAAMYAAKAQGKARHAVFDPSMRIRARSRLETEAELRRAIDQDAFEIHYQPIVDLATRQVRGFEALVRWRHPERGLVYPGEFIPLAEATGLIVPLGKLVTTAACCQLRAWRDASPRNEALTMSVNVSARQVIEPDFAEHVRRILQQTGVDPASLVLEITESLTLYRSAVSDASLRSLSDLGVTLVIDDFGTGFSALEYFKRFAVQGLKIDRSFVDGLGRSREDTAIVTATLAFASALGLTVTAEGVETEDQVDRLRALGCERAQGYLFGHPVPASEVTSLAA